MAVSVRHPLGREEELAALLDRLDAPAESFGVAVIWGEAGIGKTSLSNAVTEAAAELGYLVLSCRPSEVEAGFSFVGLADLLGGVVDDVLPDVPRPQRRALETALGRSEVEGERADEGLVAFAFLTVLRTLAQRQRLLLAIDDVQWLDAPSLAMLRYALPRLEEEAVATLLAARDVVPPWLPRAIPPERLSTIELGPLSLGALHELLRIRTGTPFPRPILLRIGETSGGNPFFALELASAVQRRGGVEPGEELPIPTALEDLVLERLDILGPAGAHVTAVVAALVEPTVHLVELAAGQDADGGLAEALEAGILEIAGDRIAFTHPLLRSAVSTRSTPAQQRALHARLSGLVVEREEQARHLALATPLPDRQVAAVVEAAAESVRARGATAAAVELADLAVRLTPPADADDLRRRVLDSADMQCEAGDGRRAIAQLEEARKEAAAGPTAATVLVRLARVVEVVDGPGEAVDLYREALVEAQGDEALEAEIQLRLAGAVAETDDRRSGLAHAELAVERASGVDDAALRCRALSMYGLLRFGTGQGIPGEEMEQALALEQSLGAWQVDGAASSSFGFQLVWAGELDRARTLIDEWRVAMGSRDRPEEADALWLLSILEWRAGNWDIGARHASDLLALRAQFGREGAQPIAEMPAAMIAAHQGQIDEARERSLRAIAVAEAHDVRIAQSGHRCVLGFIELSLGDPAAALVYLERAWSIRDDVQLLEPGHRLELADTLEALVSVGDLEGAERRLRPWEDRARLLDRAWALAITARSRALLLAAQGDLDGAQVSLRAALAEHARAEDPFQRARTLLVLGATQRRAKQRGAARATLTEALAAFEHVGAPLWVEKARTELARIGGRTPSGDELTVAERRIAELVAEGHTNREVAAALFITEHTVEAALTRTYRKLGIRSRGELAHRLPPED